MSGDALFAVDGMMARLRKVREAAARTAALRDRLAADLSELEGEHTDLSQSLVLKLKVGELFRTLMDKLVAKQVEALRVVVSEGLHTIFHDQALAFEADVGVKYNKVSIEFLLRQGDGDLVIEGKPTESFGGGPASISALLLRVLTLLRMRGTPVFFLDESLSAVSDEYIDQTGRFLARFAERIGADVLLVTHKQSFLDHATSAYQGTQVCLADGSRHLHLKAVHHEVRNRGQ